MDFDELLKPPATLPDLSFEEAQGLRGMLANFINSNEWEWFKRQIETNLRGEHNHLINDKGEEIYRAQGAFRALDTILKTPEYTLKVLDQILQERDEN